MRFLIITWLGLILPAQSISQVDQELTEIIKSTSPEAIEAHMRFLSDDLLEGRFPGTRGYALASNYVQSQFISMGVKPGLAKGYEQEVPLLKKYVDPVQCRILKDGQDFLSYGQDYFPDYGAEEGLTEVSGPLVFAGFGYSEPELGYDDYKKLDVKDKIVVIISGSPKGIPQDVKTEYRLSKKSEIAAEKGAIGLLYLLPDGYSQDRFESAVFRRKKGSLTLAQPLNQKENNKEELKARVYIHPEPANKLFSETKTKAKDLYKMAEDGKTKSFDLKIEATIQTYTSLVPVRGTNVIGVIEGSDPELKKEHIIYTAHLDHMGIGKPVDGDSIYNGAHDNAGGIAVLLEIARAFSKLEEPPKRSMVFAAVTGEESGRLGSKFLAENPPMGMEIIADLNMDMPFFFHPILDIVPYGAKRSTMGDKVEKAAKDLGIKTSPDPFPEQRVFMRSDHYSFVQKGIPAVFIKSGFETIESDTIDRAKSDLAWRTTHYHLPQDEMDQDFDFDAATMHVKVNFLIGQYISEDPEKPKWIEGDYYGEKYGRK